MIEGYVGLIGGGKSLNATDRMMRYMASGGVVYTNMTLIRNPWHNLRYAHKMKEFRRLDVPIGSCWSLGEDRFVYDDSGLCLCRVDSDGWAWSNSCGFEDYLKRTYKWRYQEGQYNQLSNEDLAGELHALIPCGTPDKPVLCVLDEAVDFFDADDRGKANREFLSFLRHSRKQSVDMIFIAQDFTELNKRIRNQTHFIWTFWDMQTFKVPGLRSTLPPPWKNMILCQQWNRNMSGGPLKRVWKTRDVGLFGCYRTDELFRALKSSDGKTDFSGEGNIIQGGFRMKPLEKVALFACLLLSVLNFFGSSGNEEDSSDAAVLLEDSSTQTEAEEYIPWVSVAHGRFSYHLYNGRLINLTVDGVPYRVGQQTERGVVLAVSPAQIHIMDARGNSTFLYPDYSHRYDVERDQTTTWSGRASEGAAKSSSHLGI